MLTITLIRSSASLAYSIFPESLKTQSCFEFFPLLLPNLQKYGWTDSPQELSIPGISSKRPLSKGLGAGPIPGMRPAQALTAIQTMTDHSQKWLDAKFAKDLTSTRIVPSMRKLNKLKRSDIENLDEQRPLTRTMEESFM
ncbi:hypothetical protein Tco_0757307 [Tanacetum coccineum]